MYPSVSRTEQISYLVPQRIVAEFGKPNNTIRKASNTRASKSASIVVGVDTTVYLGARWRRGETPVVNRGRASRGRALLATLEHSGGSGGPLYHRLVFLIGQYVAIGIGRRGGHVVRTCWIQMMAGQVRHRGG